MATNKRYGGSFAPPINKDKLAEYKRLAAAAPDKIREAMHELIKMLEVFWETPDSQRPGKQHPSGAGTIVPLEDAEIERIWDYVPWEDELNIYGQRFDELPKGELRNAAFHLLWYGRELCADREPITNDKL